MWEQQSTLSKEDFVEAVRAKLPPDLTHFGPKLLGILESVAKLGGPPYYVYQIPGVIEILSNVYTCAKSRSQERPRRESKIRKGVVQIVSNLPEGKEGEIIKKALNETRLISCRGWIGINTPHLHHEVIGNQYFPFGHDVMEISLDQFCGEGFEGYVVLPRDSELREADLIYLPVPVRPRASLFFPDELRIESAVISVIHIPAKEPLDPLKGASLPDRFYPEFLKLDTSEEQEVRDYLIKYAWGYPFGSWPTERVFEGIRNIQAQLKGFVVNVKEGKVGPGSLPRYEGFSISGKSLGLPESESIEIRCYYGWPDYFEWELWEDQSSGDSRISTCNRCGKVIFSSKGGRKKEYCSRDDNPECFRARRRQSVHRSRGNKPKM